VLITARSPFTRAATSPWGHKIDGSSNVSLVSTLGSIAIGGKIDHNSHVTLSAAGNIRIGESGNDGGERKIDGNSHVDARAGGTIHLFNKINRASAAEPADNSRLLACRRQPSSIRTRNQSSLCALLACELTGTSFSNDEALTVGAVGWTLTKRRRSLGRNRSKSCDCRATSYSGSRRLYRSADSTRTTRRWSEWGTYSDNDASPPRSKSASVRRLWTLS
jgi:hypothetical protein